VHALFFICQFDRSNDWLTGDIGQVNVKSGLPQRKPAS